ncbi:MAG TPA: DUF4136 domain-containing protein [Cyclobacteriaceae bacterium]|nr:DUF4136 domain-containing protein [Cyclobacteriaceae bacterium]
MKRALPIGLLLLTCVSCMQEPETGNLVKYMMVQTAYNEDFINTNENIFDTYSTFVIREDTIGFVSNLSDTKYFTEEDLPDFVTPVVGAIRDGFAQDYQQVTETDNPDFAVNVVILQNFSYYQSFNYGYGYPGSYYGYYGYYYPMVSTYYSNYVTLLVQVVDAKNPNFENEYPIIWSAYIGDLNATMDLKGKTLEAVEQAFEQSPYLKKN